MLNPYNFYYFKNILFIVTPPYHPWGDDDQRTGVLIDDKKLEKLHIPVDSINAVDESGHLLVLFVRRKPEP